MSDNRFGAGEADGDAEPQPRRTSLAAILGVLLAGGSLLLPATWALAVSAGAILFGVVARRQYKQDPRTGPSWLSLVALIVGGFVFVSQAVILILVSSG